MNDVLDETDLRVLHALQIEPRAAWSDLAPAVGVDAATIARRWARLQDAGIAWITGYSNHGQGALLEVECDLAALDDVAGALQRDPSVVVLDHASGSRDLLALVQTPDMASLSSYAVRRLGGLEGIRAVRTHLTNELLIEASSWRLRALDADEVARIRPPRPPRPRAGAHVPEELTRALLNELWTDGRMSITALAERTGFGPQRIADAIATLRQRGDLRLRADLARGFTGWPIYTWYFVEAPARVVDAARHAIRSVPEVRLAMTAASRYNLILAVWLRTLADVNRFEIALETALQGARIADRAVVLRISKQMGRSVGADTRAISLVSGPFGTL
ncbi:MULTISPECIES: Lrp/AsnC family transcriptional regulator [unclassified Microbacterium]|uniref:Lrp/AsnC family transcriptional regulator n=1 Tax=unclassified Microbacterium TaxID=2609290 RepID=UPI00301AD129